MTHYRLHVLDTADQAYQALPQDIQHEVDRLLKRVLADPTSGVAVFDLRPGHRNWTARFAHGRGALVYAVVPSPTGRALPQPEQVANPRWQPTIIVLRIDYGD